MDYINSKIPCAVPPQPQVQERFNHARLRNESIILPPKQVGMDDGTIFGPSHPQAGRSGRAALDRDPQLRGALNVVIVLVDFPHKAMAPGTTERIRDLFFSDRIGSVSSYYADVSRGHISAITGDVVGPYRLPLPMSLYANGAYGLGLAEPNSRTMASHAYDAAAADIDLTKYDNDNNGYVDAFIVVHAGTDGAATGDHSDIWSCKWVMPEEKIGNGGKKAYAFLTVPEDAQVGVCAHELGHLLFGWPDLYDLTPPGKGVGYWCLMGYGCYGGSPLGTVPTHPSAWCKMEQGWVTVINETNCRRVTVNDVKTDGHIHRLWTNGEASPEYFLVENRMQLGYDASLPGSGLQIWHIDENVFDNNNEDHYHVALVEADAKKDLEVGASYGDAGDVFPGASNNRSFDSCTHPNSNAYDGTATSVAITEIAPANSKMSVVMCTAPRG